ncbi:MAG: SDR family NAD(P)-dependent oxidoreductase [Hyphomicrobiales bacterium]
MADQDGHPVALITGASSGIGEMLAYEIASSGYTVVLTARSESELNRVAGVMTAKLDTTAIPIAADISDPVSIDELHDELRRRGLQVDVLVNNAGFGLNGAATDLNRAQQSKMIDLNVRGLTDMTLRFLPYMQARGSGGVINMASMAAFMPGPYMAVYYATKAYVLSFSKALASEVQGSGVTISVACPGAVDTSFQARAGMEDSLVVKTTPKQSAEEVAQAVWTGFQAKNLVVVPGFSNWLLSVLVKFIPNGVISRMIKRLQVPADVD